MGDSALGRQNVCHCETVLCEAIALLSSRPLLPCSPNVVAGNVFRIFFYYIVKVVIVVADGDFVFEIVVVVSTRPLFAVFVVVVLLLEIRLLTYVTITHC